jgi:hypothetical protein
MFHKKTKKEVFTLIVTRHPADHLKTVTSQEGPSSDFDISDTHR